MDSTSRTSAKEMNESNGTFSVPHLEDLGQNVNVVNIDQDALTPGLSVVPSAAFAAQGGS